MSFFRRGIHLLPERWEKIVASDRQYFESICNHFFHNEIVFLPKNPLKLTHTPNICPEKD